MSDDKEIALLSASSVSDKSGVPLWEPYIPVADDDQDAERFGKVAVYQGLGLSSQPYPADTTGRAECVMLRNCGGRPAVCLGARDTRTASAVGNLKPGDTVLHSTGPAQAAQVQCKEDKRQVISVTKTLGGQSLAFILDGINEKLQATHAGAIFEIDKNGDISIINASGAGLLIQGGNVHIVGTPVLGAGNSPGFVIATMTVVPPPTPVAGNPLPLVPASGIALG